MMCPVMVISRWGNTKRYGNEKIPVIKLAWSFFDQASDLIRAQAEATLRTSWSHQVSLDRFFVVLHVVDGKI